jgi:hypothetical protein
VTDSFGVDNAKVGVLITTVYVLGLGYVTSKATYGPELIVQGRSFPLLATFRAVRSASRIPHESGVLHRLLRRRSFRG